MAWSSFLKGRLPASLVSLLAVVFGVFFLARLDGNPTNLFVPLNASLQQRAAYSHAHGFDQPIIVQFGHYLRDLVHLQLGTSLYTGESAASMVWRAYPETLKLVVVTMIIAIAVAIVIGTLAARYPNSAFDRAVSLTTIVALSIPGFWFAIMGVLLFALKLHWVPTSGALGPSSWILPVATLLLRPVGQLVQVVRGAMLEVLTAPYVTTARSKGAGEARVLMIHGLRNAALPTVTVAGDIVVGLLNGAVVAETVFGWPGIGKLVIDAVSNRDFAVLQAAVLFIAVAVFVLNIMLDALYAVLDPRIKRERV